MKSSDEIELEVRPLKYLSQLDESLFFAWLDKIPCVKGYEGRGNTLYVKIVKTKLDEHALRELIALLYRYDREMKQLAVFNREEFARWFPDKRKYWHKPVFGQASSKQAQLRKMQQLYHKAKNTRVKIGAQKTATKKILPAAHAVLIKSRPASSQRNQGKSKSDKS